MRAKIVRHKKNTMLQTQTNNERKKNTIEEESSAPPDRIYRKAKKKKRNGFPSVFPHFACKRMTDKHIFKQIQNRHCVKMYTSPNIDFDI